jgi:hypothetical protein
MATRLRFTDAAGMNRRLPVLVFVAALLTGVLGLAQSAAANQANGQADPVLVWSGYGAQAVTAGRAPASAMVLLGIEHIAIYDTAVALGLRADPFVARVSARVGTSAPAAIATAAHHVLVARVPAQRAFLDDKYQQYLAGVRDGTAKQRGIELGGPRRRHRITGACGLLGVRTP